MSGCCKHCLYAGWIYLATNASSANTTTTGPAPSRRLLLQDSLLPAPTNNTTSNQSTIWFKVYVGKQMQLQVTYLTTYENIGSVEVSIHPLLPGNLQHHQTLDGRGSNSTALATYTIDGKDASKKKESVAKTVLFLHPNSPVNSRTKRLALLLPAAVRRDTQYLVAFRPLSSGDDSKFKLLGIASC